MFDVFFWVSVAFAFMSGLLAEYSPRGDLDFLTDWPATAWGAYVVVENLWQPPALFNTEQRCFERPSGIPGGSPTRVCSEGFSYNENYSEDFFSGLLTHLGNSLLGGFIELMAGGMACGIAVMLMKALISGGLVRTAAPPRT
jgi:hypothetical protein